MLTISNVLLLVAIVLTVRGIVLRAPLWRADAATLAELEREPTSTLRRGRIYALLAGITLLASFVLRSLSGS